MSASPPDIRVLDWKPLRKNSLLGFAKVELASGLIISEIALMSGERGAWASPPGRPMIGRDGVALKDHGKLRYQQIIEFRDRATRDRWSNAVVDALRQQHPDALP